MGRAGSHLKDWLQALGFGLLLYSAVTFVLTGRMPVLFLAVGGALVAWYFVARRRMVWVNELTVFVAVFTGMGFQFAQQARHRRGVCTNIVAGRTEVGLPMVVATFAPDDMNDRVWPSAPRRDLFAFYLGPNVPSLSVSPAGSRPDTRVEGEALRFMSDDFTAMFDVRCRDREFAFEFFSEQMMDGLLDMARELDDVRGACFAIEDGWLQYAGLSVGDNLNTDYISEMLGLLDHAILSETPDWDSRLTFGRGVLLPDVVASLLPDYLNAVEESFPFMVREVARADAAVKAHSG